MLQRAYSQFEVKEIDAEQRVITGIASTPNTDRGGDRMTPAGARFKLPMAFRFKHTTDIGHVTSAVVKDDGILISAKILDVAEPGRLKDEVDYAWQSIKAGLARALSIGFAPLKATINKAGGMDVTEWDWLETSAVPIPMNADCTITSIKTCEGEPAVSGIGPSAPPPPGVTGPSRTVKLMRQDTPLTNYTEQIKQWEATLTAKAARMDEIMDAAAKSGETLDAAQQEEHDALAVALVDINAHIKRLTESEARSKAAAKPVAAGTPEAASAARGHQVITLKGQLPPGIRFARAAMCVAAAKGSRGDAIALATENYPDDPGIAAFVKTAVGAGTTANGQGPLLQYTDFLGDFVEYLRPGSIVGKFGTNVNGVQIPSLRRVPFNIRVATQTVGGSAYWVGQGLPKPLTKETFSTITLDFTKVATIVVLTREEVRFASPSAELKVRDDMANAVNARIDQDFINPANAGTANVKPASILSGVAATAVSGTTAAAFRVDFKNLMSAMIAANITPTTGVLIMSSTIALNLSLMMNALGQREFPDITMLGGRLFGFPVIVSEYLTSLGSPSTQEIVMVNASDIYLADDGNVTIDSSSEASLEMLDASLVQDATAGTGASLVSLWQNNLLGLRAEREITWKKRRTAAAAYLSPVAYVPS